MFKRVLLCHDGSDYGRRALRQGAELAIALGSDVHILIAVQEQVPSPSLTAAALGHACVADVQTDYNAMLLQSIQRLQERGVSAKGHVAYGNVIAKIAHYAKQNSIDLIVVGQYPKENTRRWWSGPGRQSLAESVDCAVLIAVSTETG